MTLLRVVMILLAAMPTMAQQDAKTAQLNQMENYIEVRGTGVSATGVVPRSAQGHATALRAAQLVAYRNVAETLKGVIVEGRSLAQFNSLIADEIRVDLERTRLSGGQVVRETMIDQYLTMRDPQAEVIVRFPILGNGGLLDAYMPRIVPEIVKRVDELKPYQPTPVAPPASAVPSPASEYDGLIVRVPPSFKPSIGPKLLNARGEVVYSAKDVALDIMIKRGAAQFTNDEGKASAKLRELGSQNVLIVDATVRTDTDAQLRDDDAAKIFQANKKTAFLNSARVVFVVKRAS